MELIIEEISRNRKVKARHKYASEQITIGRGYHNDLILVDPHICAEHLALKAQDGQWYVKDLDSVNGSNLDGKRVDTHWQQIRSGDVIRLGKTQLRVMLANHPVAASITLTKVEKFVEACGRWPMIIAMVLLFFLISYYLAYLQVTQVDIPYSQLFMSVSFSTLAYAMWPLLCSLLAFLNKNEARIGSQIGVSFLILNLFWLVDFIDATLAFNLSSKVHWQWLIDVLYIVLTFSLIWFNLYIAFSHSSWRRIRIAGLVTTVIFAGLYLQGASDNIDFNPHPSYDATILMPALSFSTASSTEQFINDTDELFIQVNEQREKLDNKNK
ncbi:FHA domain-containing protein [Thalassotalea ponticola]|uniref:FHA domain-containing protein n=1 Tax=Thalassotalea ponticola TaxID=1523392 RepID=UPI0025B3A14C|nr:FHA domain-containing protein [Thalassotalea ponticola]MDN3652844.1 FHA domain-containing protein [Thalassotalea ponticola]